MPPFMGIPLDHLILALDIPNEFSRLASFSNTRWASLTLALEIDCRTRNRYSPYLTEEGRVKAVRLFRPLGAPFQAAAVTAL